MMREKQFCRCGNWKWYSVRSLYRWIALGTPKKPDSSHLPGATLVEERIVLVKARSSEEALKKAEKEGLTYARSIRQTNGYGQKVRARMLKAVDAYELDSSPVAGTEVFSATEEIDASIPDERVCERPIGFREFLAADDPWPRFKFIDVKVVRLLLEMFEARNIPSPSCSGNEHDR